MKLSLSVVIVTLVAIFTVAGCSDITSPDDHRNEKSLGPGGAVKGNAHNLLGLYTFVCSPANGTVEAIPLREAGIHLNALKMLEPPPYVNVSLESQPLFNGNVLDIDIGIRNPFLGFDQYTGFDVCGIVITSGSMEGFTDPEIVIAGKGDTRLLNADGCTRWWNPVEFPHGDTIFSYIDGLLGTPSDEADFNCTINGYKYFADGLGKDDPVTLLDLSKRGLFSPGKKNIRHYKIDTSGGFIFNYAVDANWMIPQGGPPYSAPEDFPPGANRPEAFNLVVTEMVDTLYYDESTGDAGGELKLQLDVWDHFKADENQLSGESTMGLPFTTALTPIGGGVGFSTYELDFSGGGLTQNGDVDLLITVASETNDYGGILPGKPVCAYFIHTIDVEGSPPKGWARTWGGEDSESANAVAVDDWGNIFVAGKYYGTVDFDPGPGVDMHSTGGAFLSKFNPDGDFIWARTWGSYHRVFAAGVAVDEVGDIYIIGKFYGNHDFDPGVGVDIQGSHGQDDIFLSKFNTNGDFLWARTWGGGEWDDGEGIISSDDGYVYVVGRFQRNADLDPDPEEADDHTGGGLTIFLSKFDLDGDYQWGRSWGSASDDRVGGVAIDNSGYVFVPGSFYGTVDFDPGPGVDEHSTPPGNSSAFLSKFDVAGNYQWVRVWGGDGTEISRDIAIDDYNNLYITGSFTGTADFDPGPGIDEHTSNGMWDSFLSRFDTDGNFHWGRTWGGNWGDAAYGTDVDGYGDIYVAGYFRAKVDFDPSPDIDEHKSNGTDEIYLSKFDADGNFQWARTWGSVEKDYAWDVATNTVGNAYVTGLFRLVADFAPDPWIDYHASNGGQDAFLCMYAPDGNW